LGQSILNRRCLVFSWQTPIRLKQNK
jgi:hypothetical protein